MVLYDHSCWFMGTIHIHLYHQYTCLAIDITCRDVWYNRLCWILYLYTCVYICIILILQPNFHVKFYHHFWYWVVHNLLCPCEVSQKLDKTFLIGWSFVFQTIMPGPPFAFGAILVILGLLVSVFIPETAHTMALSVRSPVRRSGPGHFELGERNGNCWTTSIFVILQIAAIFQA